MELKHHTPRTCVRAAVLLIVPYGIETMFGTYNRNSGCLLIVPYGIETKEMIQDDPEFWGLLIVPYGIETVKQIC